jgi:hypothetical protein
VTTQNGNFVPRAFIVALLALSSSYCRHAAPPAGPVMAVTGGTVIDVRDGSRISNAVILVEDGRISAIGPADQTSVPPTARVVDARGKYVIPGLWDVHTHIRSQRELEVAFPLFIAYGVVGIRDSEGMFPSEFKQFGDSQRYRPRVFASGAPVVGDAPADTGPAAIVDELADKGVDFIKIMSTVPRNRFLAVAKRAHERGLQIAGHIPTSVSAAEASDVGLRTLEHLDEILLNVSSRESELRIARVAEMGRLSGKAADLVWEQTFPVIEPLLSTWDDDKAAALFKKFAENGTWQTPTLELYRAWSVAPFDDQAFWGNRDLDLVPVDWRLSWHTDRSEYLAGRPVPEQRALRRRVQQWFDSQMEVTWRMHRAGVRFLAGTDVSSGNFMVPGISLHDELVRLTEAGLSPVEALQAATINPATYLGVEDAGVLAPGKRADFLILDGDPTVSIANTRRIAAVILAGDLISRAALDEMLEMARRRAAATPVQ